MFGFVGRGEGITQFLGGYLCRAQDMSWLAKAIAVEMVEFTP